MNAIASSDAAAASSIPVPSTAPATDQIRSGFLWGFAVVLAFSATLPATRLAVPELGGTIVGLGGVAGAGQVSFRSRTREHLRAHLAFHPRSRTG